MANPWDAAPIVQPAGATFIPGAGPKDPSGYRKVPGGLAAIPGGPEDPRASAAKAAAEAAARAGASTPIEVSGQIQAAQARAVIETQAALHRALQERQLGPALTATERSTALAGFKAAQLLDKQIRDIEDRYKDGPGKTVGIRGLRDYLGTTANKRFDSAGNAPRGAVGQALGFTGGQLNTAQEAEASVGAYLPQSGDRDEVILDKIQRMKDLRDLARDRSVAQLGGMPDRAGKVMPIPADGIPADWSGLAPSPPPPGGSGGTGGGTGGSGGSPSDQRTLATREVRTEADPQASAIIDAGIRNGATDEQINSALAAIGFNATIDPKQSAAARAQLAANPGYKGSFGGASRQVANSLLSRVAASPAGAGAIAYSDGATAGAVSRIVGQEGRDAIQAVNAENPTSALLGGGLGALTASIGGGKLLGMTGLAPALARSPKLVSLAGDVTYGGIYGNNTADEGNRTLGTLGGVGGAIVGNRIGAGVTRGIGAFGRGVVDPSVQYLKSRGVPMTGGQMLGGYLKDLEDKATSVVPMIARRRTEGLEGYNAAALREGGQEIGHVPTATGNAGVEDLQAAAGKHYDATTAGISAPVSSRLRNNLGQIVQEAQTLPEDLGKKVSLALSRRVFPAIDSGDLTGEGYQQAVRGLKGYKAEATKPGFEQDYRNLLSDAQDALTSDMRRGGGASVVQGLNEADAVYRKSKILQDAIKRARNGPRGGEVEMFTPSQLNDATIANKFSGNGTSRPFYDLGTHGQRVLPSSIPDSGSAGRILPWILGGGLLGSGGVEGYKTGDVDKTASAAGAIGALALLNSRGGTKVLEKALLERPDWLRLLGERTISKAAPAGMFGRGFGTTVAGILGN